MKIFRAKPEHIILDELDDCYDCMDCGPCPDAKKIADVIPGLITKDKRLIINDCEGYRPPGPIYKTHHKVR